MATQSSARRRWKGRATRVQTFGDDNAADFTAGSKATTLFASLDDLFAEPRQQRNAA